MKRTIQFFLVDYDSGNNTAAHPIYSNDFSIVVERESGQVFFREKLSDNLTFIAEDFAWIMAQGFDAQIDIIITIKDNGIITKQWHGKFARTNCTINEVDGILKVTPETVDDYDTILATLDTEFNLADLPLPQTSIQINVPPILQLYAPGESYISNYWQGEIWETEVEPISNTSTLESIGFRLEDFVHYSYFYCRILHSSSGTGAINDMYNVNNSTYKYYSIFDHWTLGFGIVENTVYSATPTIYGQVYDANNQPTGQYYTIPVDANYVYVPFRRREWTMAHGSMWLRVEASKTTDIDNVNQTQWINSSYTLGDLLRGLISANSLGLTFQDTDAFSQFFYSNTNPVTGWAGGWHLNFTAKSNIIKLGTNTPAQNVPCTLGMVLNFLKNALNVYWSIEGGNLRLEHISYYKNGGSYSGTPTTQYDLTTMINPRNNKPWAFGQYQYQFEKYQMPQFVKWEWMDESDELFDGTGFKCKSKYVQSGNTESITVANVTSNIVKMFMQGDNFSLDGLAVIWTAANDRTDYYYFTRNIGGNWRVPNGQLSMWYLQQSVLLYDAPCEIVEASGAEHQNVDYKRTKYSEATFPADYADANQHIKTAIGDGAVDTLEINLVSHSIKAKLKYGNE